jgi:hypothetical protein
MGRKPPGVVAARLNYTRVAADGPEMSHPQATRLLQKDETMSTQTRTTTSDDAFSGKPFEVDDQVMYKNLGRESFTVQHNLVEHPLLKLDRIAELADSLPADRAEFTDHLMPDVMPDGFEQDDTVTAGDVVRGIETNGKWIVLKRVHTDPDYKRLTDWILDAIRSEKIDEEGGLIKGECYIIISSPNSNVASHFDPEYNMLWQIEGTKDVTVGHFKDSETENAEAERYYGGGHRNISDLPARANVHPLKPGVGVHIPAQAPHMITNGPTYSISLSTSFYTPVSAELVDTYAMNARLRKLGLSPKWPGERPTVDRVKSAAWKSMRVSRDKVRELTGSRS